MNSQIFLGFILILSIIILQNECSPMPSEVTSGTELADSNPANKHTSSPSVSSVSLPKTKAVDEAIKNLSSNNNGESEDLEGANTIILGVPFVGVGGYGYPGVGYGYGGGLYGR